MGWGLPMIKLAFPLQDLNVKSWEGRMPSKVKTIHSNSNQNFEKPIVLQQLEIYLFA